MARESVVANLDERRKRKAELEAVSRTSTPKPPSHIVYGDGPPQSRGSAERLSTGIWLLLILTGILFVIQWILDTASACLGLLLDWLRDYRNRKQGSGSS